MKTMVLCFRNRIIMYRYFLVIFCLCIYGLSGRAQNVLTQHNDLQRTGWNPAETTLTQANVSGGTFGKIFSRDVDDQIYCQPLIVNNVSIGGGTHNIVITATVNNTVYAFDADDPAKTTPYWSVNLTYDPANNRPVNHQDVGQNCGNYIDFSGNIGIVGTPVIDITTNTIYLVARSKGIVSNDNFVQYIHALNLVDGTDKITPQPINPSVPGTGDNGTTVTFNPATENQRPGLLLYNGVVYVSWASHCDTQPYHGWIVGFDASTLAQKYVYNSSANGGLAGIWMSGQAPSVDDQGFIYVTTGNGTTGTSTDPNDMTNRGESLLKLSTSLNLVDFFTPDDWDALNTGDLDYGCDGVLLLPNTNLSLSGSKESYLYLINNNSMGHTTTDNSNVLQMIDINVSYNGDKHIHGTPAYFKDDKGNEYIYAWAEDGLLKQIPFLRATSLFDVNNTVLGNTTLPQGMPGAMLSVSSNGAAAGTGIVWAAHPINGNANAGVVPGELQAFDATDVTHELWNSNMSGIRDSVGLLAKFVCPTIANGKVYVSTFSNKLSVYGLNAPAATNCPNPPLPSSWRSADIGYVVVPGDACYNSGTYTVTATGSDIFNSADAFHSVLQPATGNQMSMTARVVSISNAGNSSSKAGIMFRSNLDPGSANVFVGLTEGGNAVMQNRNLQNATTNAPGGGSFTAPYWVRITSTGNSYTGATSADGVNWNNITTITVALGTNMYAGLAYSSNNNSPAGTGTAVFDNVTFTSNSTPLPVVLLNFTASNEDNKYTQLRWSTSQEVDFDHFEIERSNSTSNFQSIGSVAGQGNTRSESDYTFQDANPFDGLNYYRLKMVDKDGHISYSKIMKVSFDLSIMQIYPNPAKDNIYLKNNINFTNGEPISVSLIDILGENLMSVKENTAGMDIISIAIPATVTSGSYYLVTYNSAGKKQAWKIQVRK